MGLAVEVKDVLKIFKKHKGKETRALDGVSLSIEEGELFGLLGPNGAGKTTLVRCIATLLIPDGGLIKVLDRDVFKFSYAVRRNIGLLTSGERTLYWKLSGYDNLRFFSALYGMEPKEAEKRIDFLIELLGLKEFGRERVERYSSGMRQKLSLARALLHNPNVLLLDEPTLGLDPQFSRFIRNFIKETLNHKEKKTILLTTHYMDEADELCDRIAFIDRGKIVGLNTPDGFKHQIPHKEVLEIKCQGVIEAESFKKFCKIERVSVDNENGISILRIMAQDCEAILGDIIKEISGNTRILTIDVKEPTLEDVFIYYTGRSLKVDDGIEVRPPTIDHE